MIGIQLAQHVKDSQEQDKEEPLTYLGQINPKEVEEDKDDLEFMREFYADIGEMVEIYLAKEREECPNHIEQEEKEEPPRLHKSTNPFFCRTAYGIKSVEYSDSSESDLGEVLLKIEEELKDEEEEKLGVEKGRKEVKEPVESSKSADEYLDELLLILDEDFEKIEVVEKKME